MLENPPTSHPDFDESWRRIESLVDEVAQWSKNADSFASFYGLLLPRTVTELQVAGGAVWSLDEARRVQRTDMIGSPSIDALTKSQTHLERIGEAFAPRGLDAQLEMTVGETQWHAIAANGSDARLTSCLGPVIVDEEVVALIELVLTDSSAQRRENVENVLAALTDVSVDFHRAAELRDLRHKVAAWDAAQAFSDCVHRRLDLNETCYAIANEGRSFVGADRVSILVGQGRELRVRAVSGVEAIDRRAPEVIILRRLAQAVASLGEPLWTQDLSERSPQIQQHLDAYHDISSVRCLAMIPIMSDSHAGPSRLLGVLVAEQFKSERFESVVRDRLSIVRRHAKTALGNALEMHSLPLLGLSRGIRSVAWMFGFESISVFAMTLAAALTLAVGIGATLCLVHVDFMVTARGQLQPTNQQSVFTPADGVVEQIFIQHGDEVERGDLLLQLRNTELDYESERLRGEIATTGARLAAVQAARVLEGRDRQKVVHHNAEIQRYKQILKGLNQQYEILSRQRGELTVRSQISGQVMSWDAAKMLESRPVRQGQRLMTIAQVQGPWRLEVDVPDEGIGHVLRARQHQGDEGLPVTFILLTDPSVAYRGEVADVAMGTVVAGNREPAVQVAVNIDAESLASPRPGASVVAHIHCGRRPIGYVWFRGLYEKLRMHLLF